MNILLIEDDELLAEILLYMMTEKGHKVYYAGDGKKALSLAIDNPVDLVVCDLMIPVISGVAFLDMRKKFLPDNTPVIAMSALDKAQYILKNLDLDIRHFINKPFEIEHMMEIIDQMEYENKLAKEQEQLFLLPNRSSGITNNIELN